MKSLKVLVSVSVPETIEAFLVEQVKALLESGAEVALLCSHATKLSKIFGDTVSYFDVLIPRKPTLKKVLTALVMVLKIVIEYNPTVVYSHTPVASFLVQTISCLLKVPRRICVIHGMYFINCNSFLKRMFYRYMELLTAAFATSVVCVNDEDAALIRKHICRRHVEVQNVGVDLTRFECVDKKSARNKIFKTYDIPQGTIVLGFVGRLVKEKGIEDLIITFDNITENIILVIIGPYDERARDAIDKSIYAKAVANPRIRMIGFQSKIEEVLFAIDIFCLPSYREGFPVSVMEASAAGLPVITSNIRGCREAVIDGVTGILFKCRDINQLTNAIKDLADSEDIRVRMGAAGRRLAIEKFDRAKAVEKIKSLIIDG